MSITTTTITKCRQNRFEYVRSAIEFNDVIDVTTKDGSAVVMSKEDYNAMLETFQLLSVPGMPERLVEAINTPIEECEDFEW